MVKPEILAPVGGGEQLIAALRCGADAVYLGAKGFNARRNAENFDEASLADTVSLCHQHGVKVHVTVNTLVMDTELKSLMDTAEEIAASGADAVIVQDIAVMNMFLKKYPTLDVHASTQCVVHNTDGVKFFEDMGVKRVVLARELSIKEIEKIRSETSVELEAFVHGALCMCLSGACYMSGMLGGRSGNRGLCAQPCRLNFKCGKSDYALSLKDMSHLRHIKELADAGITSFKIEGRMKRPEYVAAAVTACRKALSGEAYDEDTLRAVFSRSGFTDGYATGKRTDMFGHRSKDDVTAADKVFKELSRLYDKEKPTVPVSMSLSIGSGSSILTASALGQTARAESGEAIPAEKHPTDADYAMRFLGKCGGTQFYVSSLEAENPLGLMLPPSAMNAMRRNVLSQLNDALGKACPHEAAPFSFPKSPYTPPERQETWARFETFSQLFTSSDIDRYILPIEELDRHPELIARYGNKLSAELPAALFPETENSLRSMLSSLVSQGLSSVYTENAYGLYLGKSHGIAVYGGAGLNILSTPALEEYACLGFSAATISFELSMSAIGSLGSSLPRGYIAYGRLPLMRVRSCPNRPNANCKGCDGRPVLTDRLGVSFPMLCHGKRYTTILNSVPLHLGGKPQAMADFRTLYFTTETAEQCRNALRELINNEESTEKRTGGLYYRVLK